MRLALAAVTACARFDGLAMLAAAVSAIASLIGVVVVMIILAEVVLRSLGEQVPPGFEELANFLFVWWVLLGASVGVARRAHPRITVLLERLSPVVARPLELAGEIICLIYFGLLTVYGFRIALLATQPSLALEMPMTWAYLALGVGGGLMTVFQLAALAARGRPSFQSLLVVLTAGLLGGALYGLASFDIYAFLVAAALCLFVIGVPVAVVLGVVTLGALGFADPATMINYVIRLFDGLNNFVLLSIPLFILTGTLMSQGGISRRLVGFASGLVGWARGGLGLADIVASVFFADISGSAVSDTAAIGSIMIPGMVQRGYTRGFATALQAAAGSLGMLFPPSITMILYAWVANVSVARLFLASFLPGFLVAFTFSLVTYAVARRRDFPREPRQSVAELAARFRAAVLALFTPVIILGGILSGLFTPTEAGVIAAVYAAAIGLLGYRDLSFRDLPAIIGAATVSMSRVIFIACNAIAFSWVLIIHQGPQFVAELLPQIASSRLAILVLINLFLVVLHVFLEGASTVVAIVPVFLPLLAQMHVDPVYFGIIVMLNSAAGLLMPPVGLCLYISCSISGEKLETVAREVVPFVLAVFADIAILLLFPSITSVVPDLVLRSLPGG